MDKRRDVGPGIVRTIAAGIGFVSESTSIYKESLLTQYSSDQGSVGKAIRYMTSQHKQTHYENEDVRIRAANDAQTELESPAHTLKSKKDHKERDTNNIVSSFMNRHPSLEQLDTQGPTTKLAQPVVLPQKRPKDRSRGFVRAYAPVLAEAGIDQATFFDFLEAFEQGIQASPWLEALNLISIASFALPMPEKFVIDVAVLVAIETAKSVQTRTRGNDLLSKFNSHFFQPRGLFCLLMTLDPERDSTGQELLISSSILRARAGGLQEDNFMQTVHTLRRSDGSTNLLTIPQAAPLIFSVLDKMAEQQDPKSKKNKDSLEAASEFVSMYLDKRAVAKYSTEYPDGNLAQPKPVFRSRYADPTHLAASGSFRSLLMGGKTKAQTEHTRESKEEHVQEKKENKDIEPISCDDDTAMSADAMEKIGKNECLKICGPSRAGKSDKGAHFLTPMKNAIKSNVMYLLIVNMPSEEEMATAQTRVAEAAKGRVHAAWDRCWVS